MGATDVPATSEGLAEAQSEGAAIRALGPYRVGVSSPLARATQTLEVIRPAGLECMIDDRLGERRLGVWEGQEKKSLAREYPEAFLESGALFLREYRGEDVLVVTHNGWIRTARYLCGEIPQEQIFAENEPHNRPLSLAETAIR
jgi:broad specificity phosphatase PhoE